MLRLPNPTAPRNTDLSQHTRVIVEYDDDAAGAAEALLAVLRRPRTDETQINPEPDVADVDEAA